MKKISITFKYEEYTNDIEKIDKEPKEKGLIYEINRRDNSLDSSESDLVIDSKIISDNSSEYD